MCDSIHLACKIMDKNEKNACFKKSTILTIFTSQKEAIIMLII